MGRVAKLRSINNFINAEVKRRILMPLEFNILQNLVMSLLDRFIRLRNYVFIQFSGNEAYIPLEKN